MHDDGPWKNGGGDGQAEDEVGSSSGRRLFGDDRRVERGRTEAWRSVVPVSRCGRDTIVDVLTTDQDSVREGR